jgi:hypothetical protein
MLIFREAAMPLALIHAAIIFHHHDAAILRCHHA